MKILKLTVITLAVALSSVSANAWDIKGAINKITNPAGENPDDKNETPANTGIGGFGDVISGVAAAFGITGDFKFDDLVGEWKYKSPAVQFQSDNLLMKAGGAAAAATVEDKLAPYYKMAGCENMVLSIQSDSTFTMNLKLGKVSGTISLSDDSKQIFFNFSMFKTVKLGSMEAFITRKSANEMELTFDVSRMLEILEKIGSMSSKTSISTVTELLKQYDGMTAGFDLQK